SYTVGFHGSWGNVDNEEGTGKVWNTIDFGTATFDKDHLTATADIELDVAEGFGIKTVKAGEQVGWFNSDVIELGAGVTGITKNTGNNAACTAAGTYNVTVTFNADGQITKVLFNTFTAAADAE
ncbi:MAG: hypothetical protein K2F90_01965, partial [Clostridiales bacterium]|nr:hypothetical protein [Clostridiales bacterium]